MRIPLEMWKFLVMLSLCGLVVAQRKIKIGAIFPNSNHYESEIAFNYTVGSANWQYRNVELIPIVRHVDETNSFKAEKMVCELVALGVVAIFGPSTILTSSIATAICNSLAIPHIIVHWNPKMLGSRNQRRNMTLNIYPDTEVLAQACAALIRDYDWKSYTIIYESDSNLMKLKDVLQLHEPQDHPITVRKLTSLDDYRPMLKEIKDSKDKNIVLDISSDKTVDFLRQAHQIGMMDDYQSFILTSLDTHVNDFEELKDTLSNITSLRIMNTKSDELQNAIRTWIDGAKSDDKVFYLSPEYVQTESALFSDAVKIFAKAIKELDALGPENIMASDVDCSSNIPWHQGYRIIDYMKQMTEHGITGKIIFNPEGHRTHFHLEVTELSKTGFKQIGTWNPADGLNYTRALGEVQAQIVESIQSKVFVVASRIGAPFLTRRIPVDGQVLEGNARFEGYAMDLITEIADHLKFKFVFELVPDGGYGNFDKEKKQWNGLIRHLLDRKADLAICDLTINYERRTAVDFTMPFMTLGISILFAKPVKQEKELFSFLSPLSVEVWMYMGMAYMGVSLLIFMLSRMSPDDWEAPHPCNEDSEVENIWGMLNCVWVTMGSIMGQGCDILPKAVSTRIVCGMWWFFALIMLASYTANLAAFLTMERMDASIENAEDLAKQFKIKYGSVKDGSTMNFFKYSNFSTYQKMWTVMDSERPSVFTKDNDEGKERVLKGKGLYAFFMESVSIEYITERNCELQQIGSILDSKGYGIAMQTNSPFRTEISGAVLKLQEEGKLVQLKDKWWKASKKCDDAGASSSENAEELGMGNVGGVFVVLLGGCLVAFIVAICEFLWNIKNVAIEERITPWEALKKEAKFALNISITTKPVHRPPSDSESPKTTKSKSLKSRSQSETKSSNDNLNNRNITNSNDKSIGESMSSLSGPLFNKKIFK